MPVTADTTIIAQAIASARSVMRGMARKPRDFGALRDLAKIAEADLDGALEALKRVEAMVPLTLKGRVVGFMEPAEADALAIATDMTSVGYSVCDPGP